MIRLTSHLRTQLCLLRTVTIHIAVACGPGGRRQLPPAAQPRPAERRSAAGVDASSDGTALPREHGCAKREPRRSLRLTDRQLIRDRSLARTRQGA
ncbi:hypothetical protein OAO87_02810 [bacterium]|nr:hypothetical protein [bacterium]